MSTVQDFVRELQRAGKPYTITRRVGVQIANKLGSRSSLNDGNLLVHACRSDVNAALTFAESLRCEFVMLRKTEPSLFVAHVKRDTVDGTFEAALPAHALVLAAINAVLTHRGGS